MGLLTKTDILLDCLNRQYGKTGLFTVDTIQEKYYLRNAIVKFTDFLTDESYVILELSFKGEVSQNSVEVNRVLDAAIFDEIISHMLWSVKGENMSSRIIPIQKLITSGYGRESEVV